MAATGLFPEAAEHDGQDPGLGGGAQCPGHVRLLSTLWTAGISGPSLEAHHHIRRALSMRLMVTRESAPESGRRY